MVPRCKAIPVECFEKSNTSEKKGAPVDHSCAVLRIEQHVSQTNIASGEYYSARVSAGFAAPFSRARMARAPFANEIYLPYCWKTLIRP